MIEQVPSGNAWKNHWSPFDFRLLQQFTELTWSLPVFLLPLGDPDIVCHSCPGEVWAIPALLPEINRVEGEQRASLGVQMSLKGLLKAKADFKWGRELGLQGV